MASVKFSRRRSSWLRTVLVIVVAFECSHLVGGENSKNSAEDASTDRDDDVSRSPSGGVINFNNPKLLKELASYSSIGGDDTGYDTTYYDFSEMVEREAEVLAMKLRLLTDKEMGYETMQKVYDSSAYSEKQLTSEQQVQQVSKRIKSKFSKYLKALKMNKEAVEDLYRQHLSSPLTSVQACCKISPVSLRNSSVFQAFVTNTTTCDRLSPVTPSGKVFSPGKNLTRVFSKNLREKPSLKWQYFVSEEGLETLYPATDWRSSHRHSITCQDDFDPRSRPVYVATTHRQPLHLVIMLDRGSTVDNDLLVIAKQAALVAMDTLSEKDRVGVVSLSSKVKVNEKDDCYSQLLAPATFEAKQQLGNYINSLQSDSTVTNHTLGVLKSFELMHNTKAEMSSGDGASVSPVILYISSGVTTGIEESRATISSVIAENEKLNNKALIMTYALLKEGKTGLAELGFLKNLAEQNVMKYVVPAENDTSLPVVVTASGPILKGQMSVLNIMSHLHSSIGRFYTALPANFSTQPVFSYPYMDQIGNGLIMSLTQACYHDDKLLGMVGIDLSMSDVLEDVTYYEEGQRSYTFLLDTNGYVLGHPSLPRPFFMTEQPYHATMPHYEPHQGFAALRQAIGSGAPGGHWFHYHNATSGQGSGPLYKYTWRKVDNTPYLVCLVVGRGEGGPRRDLRAFATEARVLYHRLDLLRAEGICLHLRQLATLESSTVMLTAASFTSPYAYLSGNETRHLVQVYLAYLNDNTRLISNLGLRSAVKNDALLTAAIDKHWKERHRHGDLKDYIIRRYMATTSGVYRVYPGVLNDKRFDPSQRPWYKMAMAHPGQVTLSAPHLDVGGAGYVVTVSHTVYEGRADRAGLDQGTEPVAAVMGIDFTLHYFFKLLKDIFPICNQPHIRCFVMDDNGYLVAHPELVEPNGKGPREKNHITHMEPLVANDILNHQHFVVKKLCNSYHDRTIQRFYQFNTSLDGVLTNLVHGDHCSKYRLARLPGTNAFVGMVNETCQVITAFCPCSTVDWLCLNCHRMEQNECECPCECPLEFDQCKGLLKAEEDRNPSCSIKPEPVFMAEVSTAVTKGLTQCFDSQCSTRNSLNECFGVKGCEWCQLEVVKSESGKVETSPLNQPFCASSRVCFGGVLGAETPYNDQLSPEPEVYAVQSEAGPPIGPLAGGVLGVVLVIGLVVYMYRHHINRLQQQEMLQVQEACMPMAQMGDRDDELDPDPPLDEDPPRPPPSNRRRHANMMMRAGSLGLQQPRHYYEVRRHRGAGRHWRSPGDSSSDHGYSTMTQHEDPDADDSEYVEREWARPPPPSASPAADKHLHAVAPPQSARLLKGKGAARLAAQYDRPDSASTGLLEVLQETTVLPGSKVEAPVEVHMVDTRC